MSCYTVFCMKFSSSWILYGAAVLVIVGLIVFAVTKNVAPGEHDQFAQCLTDKGVKMYGAWWCPHCQKQKALFGNSFSKMKYIECSAPGTQQMNQVCREANIKGYPTWEFGDGSRVSGEQSLEDLGKKVGCAL